ncbi:MAG: phage portal protein [Thermoleophilia bacterium]|nr:phage portal protein [Thermoleophilia bacterium]
MRVVTREGTSAEIFAAATSSTMGGIGDRGRYDAAARMADLLTNGTPGNSTLDGEVTPDSALGISAVYACVALVSRLLGPMPLQTFEKDITSGLLRPVANDVQSDMLEYQFNREQAADLVVTLLVVHLLLRGNAYLAKERDASGRVIGLWPLHPDRVIPWRDENGNKWFQVSADSGHGIAHYSRYHVLHIVGHSLSTGLEGHSVVGVQRVNLQSMMAAINQQAKLFKSGLNVSATMSVPQDLDAEGETTKALRRDIRTFYSGASNAGSVLLLEQGMEFTPVSISPHDAQFIEQKQAGATEVASWFCVPPAEIGANAGGSSLQYETTQGNDLNLLKKGLKFWMSRICSDLFIDPDLFGLGCGRVPRFNSASLLDVDIKTRMEVNEIGSRIGLFSPNDIAGIEGHDPKLGPVHDMTKPEIDLKMAEIKVSGANPAIDTSITEPTKS